MVGRFIRACAPLALVVGTWAGTAAAMDPPGSSSGGPPPSSAAPLACTSSVPSQDQNALPLVWGVVKPTDPVHNGHLHALGSPNNDPFSACGFTPPVPSVVEPDRSFHYRTHRLKNWTKADACVHVEVYFYACGRREACPPEVGSCANPFDCDSGVGLHESAIYKHSFDPSNIQKDWIADGRTFTGGPGLSVFDFTLSANDDVVIVISAPDFSQKGYDPYYDIFATGCGAPNNASSNNNASSQSPNASTSAEPPPSGGAGGGGNVSSETPESQTVLKSTSQETGSEVGGGGCNATGTTSTSVAGVFGVMLAVAAVLRRRRA